MLIKLLLLITLFSFQCIASDAIRVMVIDTGVDLSHPEIRSHIKENTNTDDYIDIIGHGTAMSSLVLKDTCPEVELVSCRYYDPSLKDLIQRSNNCFQRALIENIQYINYSSYGKNSNEQERNILTKLSDKGVIITVSAGNDGRNLINPLTKECERSYPSCYLLKNVYIVQNIDENGNLVESSNYINHPNTRSEMGLNVPVLAPNNGTTQTTGTSPATAKYMNRLLLQRCKEIKKESLLNYNFFDTMEIK